MDFLGWYSTGDSPGVQEIAVHQQISDINESPLFLQVSMLHYSTSVKISRYVCDCLCRYIRWPLELPQQTYRCHCTSLS